MCTSLNDRVSNQRSEGVRHLDEELHGLDVRIVMQWKRDIRVQHVLERRASAPDSQPQADVAQPAGILGVAKGTAPGAARIVEHRSTDPEEAPQVPVRVDALLD